MPKPPSKKTIDLAKKALSEASQVKDKFSFPVDGSLKKAKIEKAMLKTPDYSDEEIESDGVEKAVEGGEFVESSLSNISAASALAALAKIQGAAKLAEKTGSRAAALNLALQGVDLARTVVDEKYREEAKESLNGMSAVDGFQQGVTRLPSTVQALQEVNMETADKFAEVENEEMNTDRKWAEYRKKKKARNEETGRINEDQRRVLDRVGVEERTRMAQADPDFDKKEGMMLVRSYFENNRLV